MKKPKIIKGIHNYCDRWCERCPMTAHCTVFAMEQVEKEYRETAKHTDEKDEENQAFWDGLQEAMESAMKEIMDDGKEHGYEFELTFDEAVEEEDAGFKAEPIEWKPKRARRRKTRIPTLSASAQEYMDRVRAFLERHSADFDDKDAVRRLLEIRKAAGVNPGTDFALVADAIDVLAWYHTLLTVKLMRALGTHDSDEDEDEQDEEFQELLEKMHRDDADGSAKVSLIGINRSIQAWAVIHQKLPHVSGDALEFISRLTDLRDRVQSSFPNARRFKRPGFDD